MITETVRITFLEQPCEIVFDYIPRVTRDEASDSVIDIKSIVVFYGQNQRIDLFPLLSLDGIRMAEEAIDEFYAESENPPSEDEEPNAYL